MAPDNETNAWLEAEPDLRIQLRGMCTFGRTSDNTVVLKTPKASRHHAMIHEQGGEFWLVDLGSTNGIEINGERVTHPLKLRSGDRIQMSEIAFVFREAIEPPALLMATHKSHFEVTIPEIQTMPCWMLVADIKGFTKLSQQMAAAEIAPLVGKWMADCQAILFRNKGVLRKFLGDGFLAYWPVRDNTVELIAAACLEFQAQQNASLLPFRLAVHYGEVAFGGSSPDASHSMIGPELNFAFRLEKVASRENFFWIFSESACGHLQAHLPLVSCGLQKIPDFEPERPCFTLGEVSNP